MLFVCALSYNGLPTHVGAENIACDTTTHDVIADLRLIHAYDCVNILTTRCEDITHIVGGYPLSLNTPVFKRYPFYTSTFM